MTTALFGDGIRLDCIRQCNPVDLVNYKIFKSVIAMQSTTVITEAGYNEILAYSEM